MVREPSLEEKWGPVIRETSLNQQSWLHWVDRKCPEAMEREAERSRWAVGTYQREAGESLNSLEQEYRQVTLLPLAKAHTEAIIKSFFTPIRISSAGMFQSTVDSIT